MSYLLFLDESGHDHRACPYEVRGGIALHISRLWSFIQDMQALEVRCFGDSLHKFGLEIKGERLLKKRRFKNASQLPDFDESTRRKHTLSFLNKGASNSGQSKAEFTAYSQACLCMAQSVFELLDKNDAKVFAVAIPRGVEKPQTGVPVDFCGKTRYSYSKGFITILRNKRNMV